MLKIRAYWLASFFMLISATLAQETTGQANLLDDCSARVLLVVNDQVVSKTVIYNQDGREQRQEQYRNLTEASFVSSFLTQYFLASPVALFEPGQLLRELERQQTPQTVDQLLNKITTVEADFVVTTTVDVTSSPYQLNNGDTLYDAQAAVSLTIFRASSGGEIVAETFLEGRSRLDYPSEQRARKTAVERAIRTLVNGEPFLDATNVRQSSLISSLCQAYTQAAPHSGDSATAEGPSMRIQMQGFSSYNQALEVNSLLETINQLKIIDFTFNTSSADFTIAVPPGFSIHDVAKLLTTIEKPSMKVIQVQETFIRLEVEFGL